MLAALRHTLIRTWGTLNKQAHSAQHPRTATKKMTDSMLLSCHIKIVAHEKIYSKSSQSQELRCKKVSYKRSRPVFRIRFHMMILFIVYFYCIEELPSVLQAIGKLTSALQNGRSHVKCSHIFSCNNQTNTEYFYQHFTSSMFSKIFDWCFKQGNKSSNIGCYPNVQGAAAVSWRQAGGTDAELPSWLRLVSSGAQHSTHTNTALIGGGTQLLKTSPAPQHRR